MLKRAAAGLMVLSVAWLSFAATVEEVGISGADGTKTARVIYPGHYHKDPGAGFPLVVLRDIDRPTPAVEAFADGYRDAVFVCAGRADRRALLAELSKNRRLFTFPRGRIEISSADLSTPDAADKLRTYFKCARYVAAAPKLVRYGARIYRRDRRDTPPPEITVPPPWRLIEGDPGETGCDRRLFYFTIEAEGEGLASPEVKVSWPGVEISSVDGAFNVRKSDDGVVLMPVAESGGANYLTYVREGSIEQAFHHHVEGAAHGPYAGRPLPWTKIKAGDNWRAACRLMLIDAGLDKTEATGGASIKLYGFDSNFPRRHVDCPEHFHVMLEWDNWTKNNVGHYTLDDKGLIKGNNFLVCGDIKGGLADGYHRQKRGETTRYVGPDGLCFSLEMLSDGTGLVLRKPGTDTLWRVRSVRPDEEISLSRRMNGQTAWTDLGTVSVVDDTVAGEIDFRFKPAKGNTVHDFVFYNPDTGNFLSATKGRGLSVLDYSVIAFFFALMVSVGFYYSRKSRSSDQFFGNDKTVPWWLSGISFYMNSFSALAFVMYSALAYKFGWVPVTVSWLSVPAVLLGGWFLAVRWRRAATGSPIDYIATRYTPKMCGTLAVLGLPMQLLDNALKLLAIGTVVGVGMGFPLFWSICLSGVIIVLYTVMGGLKATLMCDFIQFLFILAVVFALPPLCLERLAATDGGSGLMHGWRVFVENVPDGFFNFTNGRYGWIYMLVFFCCVGSTLSTNWSLVQRYYSTKSDRDARKMAYLVAALLFIGPPLFFFPAMAARIFLPQIPDAEMNGVYAILCREVLPVGMIGMVIAAMFSATMSSLAGNFNAAAAVMVNEVYLRVDKTATASRRMIAARVATVLVGGLVVALTFVMQYAQGADDLFNLSNKVFGVFLPPIAIPMLCGVFVKRFTTRAGLVGLVGGITVGLAIFVAGAWHPHLREMVWIFPLTSVATVAFLIVATALLPDGPEERKRIDTFFRRIEGKAGTDPV